ncbi:rhs core protein [Superficieibacter electus]|uniref:Rhs core protein n=1 Tax=Superficieibacter electus TaxID=2022662 RepID=A0A2P5GVI7_9ENTR|nr:rhs core protein [Superficieibacter electus]POP50575.1 rhs core protein [Superficieibacter electus]
MNTYLEKELFIKRIKQNEDRAFVLRDRLYYSINEIMRKDCLLVMDNKTSEN